MATHEADRLAAHNTVNTEHTRHCNHDKRIQGGAPTKSPSHSSNRLKLLSITFEPPISVPAEASGTHNIKADLFLLFVVWLECTYQI